MRLAVCVFSFQKICFWNSTKSTETLQKCYIQLLEAVAKKEKCNTKKETKNKKNFKSLLLAIEDALWSTIPKHRTRTLGKHEFTINRIRLKTPSTVIQLNRFEKHGSLLPLKLWRAESS